MSKLRKALTAICNAAAANPHPIHFKVKEAIDKARVVLSETEYREPRYPVPVKKMPRY